jgi:hypothetical protein
MLPAIFAGSKTFASSSPRTTQPRRAAWLSELGSGSAPSDISRSLGRPGRVAHTRELVIPRTPYIVLIGSTVRSFKSSPYCTALSDGLTVRHRRCRPARQWNMCGCAVPAKAGTYSSAAGAPKGWTPAFAGEACRIVRRYESLVSS